MKKQQESLYRLGCWVRDNGIATAGPWSGMRNYLRRTPPSLKKTETLSSQPLQRIFCDELTRIVAALDGSILACAGSAWIR